MRLRPPGGYDIHSEQVSGQTPGLVDCEISAPGIGGPWPMSISVFPYLWVTWGHVSSYTSWSPAPGQSEDWRAYRQGGRTLFRTGGISSKEGTDPEKPRGWVGGGTACDGGAMQPWGFCRAGASGKGGEERDALNFLRDPRACPPPRPLPLETVSWLHGVERAGPRGPWNETGA